ncbi:hypothetical protein T484DRAFT_1628319, partial [Baffinella frigidus]
NPQPSTPNPQPSTLNLQPSTLNTQHSTLNPKPSTPNRINHTPSPETHNPQPSTLNPQPSTLNPKPNDAHSLTPVPFLYQSSCCKFKLWRDQVYSVRARILMRIDDKVAPDRLGQGPPLHAGKGVER